jgi:5-formyltetrahydrofolate cyclo-ligase
MALLQEGRAEWVSMSGAGPSSKPRIRELVWRAMEIRGLARFPGASGRIPNFPGAERAALRLAELPAWREARVVKINPDAPQLPVRRLALRQGKVVYVAVPRLRTMACFLELDPARLGPAARQAASIAGSARLGLAVGVEAVRRVDLIVCGSVAVNRCGARVGKGGGFSDLEYALLVAASRVGPGTPVVTTVHPVQLLAEEIAMEAHDLPVDVVVTPDGPVRTTPTFPRPCGIYPEVLSDAKMAEVPVLQALVSRRP